MAKKQPMVCVIDDDESVRAVLAMLLRSANFNVGTFSSTDEFLSSPRQKENGCILVDMRVLGSTGFDLQQKLMALGIRLPVIVVFASDDPRIRGHARQLGAVSFFRKPVDVQALLDALWWVISGAST